MGNLAFGPSFLMRSGGWEERWVTAGSGAGAVVIAMTFELEEAIGEVGFGFRRFGRGE